MSMSNTPSIQQKYHHVLESFSVAIIVSSLSIFGQKSWLAQGLVLLCYAEIFMVQRSDHHFLTTSDSDKEDSSTSAPEVDRRLKSKIHKGVDSVARHPVGD